MIKPLRQADNGVVFGMEYNLTNTYANGLGGNLPRSFYQVEPRFMVWTIEDLPASRSALSQSSVLRSSTRVYHRAFPSNSEQEYDGFQ